MAEFGSPLRNVAFEFYMSLVSQANTKIFQANPTLAAGDFTISIDGGTAANLATLPTVTPAAGKRIRVQLSAAEMTGSNIVVTGSDVAGAEWCDATISLQTVDVGVVFATVGSGSTTTSIVTSAMSPAAAVTDQYKARVVIFRRNTTTANLRGQGSSITASTAGGVLTVDQLSTAPVSGDTFDIL